MRRNFCNRSSYCTPPPWLLLRDLLNVPPCSQSYTFSIILSMTGQTVFLRIHFLYKLILNVLAIICYVVHYDQKNSSANPLFVSDW